MLRKFWGSGFQNVHNLCEDHPLFDDKRRKARPELAAWGARTKIIATALTQDEVIKGVEYPKSCGALCRTCSSARSLRLHKKVLAALTLLIKSLSENNKLARSSLLDLLLAIELHSVARPAAAHNADDVIFVAISTGLGRRGRFEENFTVSRLTVQSGVIQHPFVDIILQDQRSEPIRSDRSWHQPLNDELRVGPLVLHSDDRLVADICTCGPAALPTVTVVVWPLRWHQVLGRLDGYVVDGAHDGPPCLVTEAAEPCVVVPAAPIHAPDAQDPPDGDFDFLGDMLEQDAMRAREQRQQGGGRGRGHQVGQGRRHADDADNAEAAPTSCSEFDLPGELERMIDEMEEEAHAELRSGIELEGELANMHDDDEHCFDWDAGDDGVPVVTAEDDFSEVFRPADVGAGQDISQANTSNIGEMIVNTLDALSIVNEGGKLRDKMNRKHVGWVHTVFTGVKATCLLHKDCICYLNVPSTKTRAEVELDLLQWMNKAAR